MSTKKLVSVVLVGLLGLIAGAGCIGDADQEDEQLGNVEQDVVSPPTNLVATVASATSINLSWNAVPGATKYIIFKGTAPGNEVQFTSNAPPTATTFFDSHDTPNTQYCFQVTVFVTGGGQSARSNESCVTTSAGPQPPANVQAVAISSSRITVTWNAVPGAVRYYVFESTGGSAFTSIGNVAAPTTTFTVANLQPATTYSFEVETFISNSSISPLSTPPATATTFALGLEAYYKFDDKTGTTALDSSGFQRNGTLSGGAVFSTTDAAPLKDSTGHNPSSLTLPSSTSTMSVTQSPVNFLVDSSLSMWVKLTAAPTGTVSILGRRGPSCGTLNWQLTQDTTNMLHFDGTAIRSFGQSLVVGTWTHIAVVKTGANVQLYLNGVMVNSGSYTPGPSNTTPLQIGNVGGCGNKGAFNVDEMRMFSRALSASEVAALGTPPPAPTNLAAIEVHSTRVKLSWTASPGASQYFVFKGSAAGNETFFTSDQVTTFVGDHLTPSQTTSWKTFALSSGGLISAPSNEVVVTTLAPPPPPTNLTAMLSACCNHGRIDLAWTAEPRATRYVIFQSKAGAAFAQVAQVAAPAVSFEVANLTAGTMYTYEVESEDDGLTFSIPSTTASATTP